MKIIRLNSEIIRERQLAVSRELDRRGISRKMIAYDAGIKYDTLCSYFPAGERAVSEIPGGAIAALCRAESMPADLVSMLLDDGFAIVKVPAGLDYDDVSERCRHFLDTKEKAHHPESEAGREIGPVETEALGENVVRLGAVA